MLTSIEGSPSTPRINLLFEILFNVFYSTILLIIILTVSYVKKTSLIHE